MNLAKHSLFVLLRRLNSVDLAFYPSLNVIGRNRLLRPGVRQA